MAVTLKDLEQIIDGLVDYDGLAYFKSRLDEIYATKDEIAEGGKVKWEDIVGKPGTLLNFKGNVNTVSDLDSIENPSVGDVYNILDTNMNVVWTGEKWDEFSMDIDLSGYIQKDDLQFATKDDIDILFVDAADAATTEDSLKTLAARGGEIGITKDFTKDAAKITEEDRTVISQNANVNFYNKTITVPAALGALEPVESKNWSGIYVDGEGVNVVIDGTTGGIQVEETTNQDSPYAITAMNGATITINGGHYKGGGTTVYALSGHIIINDGFFEAWPWQNGPSNPLKPWTLNCKNDAYQEGRASITVKGGTYVNFDPSNPQVDDAETYVAEGYEVQSEDKGEGITWYKVVKSST